MTGPVKPFRVEVRLKNNLLVETRESKGLTLSEASRASGIPLGHICGLETMYDKPTGRGGVWRPIAVKLALFYGCTPEDLWPEEVRAVQKARASLKADAEQMHALGALASQLPSEILEQKELWDAVSEALRRCTPREAKVLLSNVSTGTDEAAAVEYGIERERVRITLWSTDGPDPICTKCDADNVPGHVCGVPRNTDVCMPAYETCRRPGQHCTWHKPKPEPREYNFPIMISLEDGRAPNHPDFANAPAFALNTPEPEGNLLVCSCCMAKASACHCIGPSDSMHDAMVFRANNPYIRQREL